MTVSEELVGRNVFETRNVSGEGAIMSKQSHPSDVMFLCESLKKLTAATLDIKVRLELAEKRIHNICEFIGNGDREDAKIKLVKSEFENLRNAADADFDEEGARLAKDLLNAMESICVRSKL